MIRPLNKRLLIKEKDRDKFSKGGIILTDSTIEKPSEGTIISMATDCICDLKEEANVLYHKYAGMRVYDTETNKEYLVIDECDLVGERV